MYKKWIYDYIAYKYENEGVLPDIEEMYEVFQPELKRGEDPRLIEEGLNNFPHPIKEEK